MKVYICVCGCIHMCINIHTDVPSYLRGIVMIYGLHTRSIPSRGSSAIDITILMSDLGQDRGIYVIPLFWLKATSSARQLVKGLASATPYTGIISYEFSVICSRSQLGPHLRSRIELVLYGTYRPYMVAEPW